MLTRRLLVPLAIAPFAVGAVLTGTASAAPAAPAAAFTATGVSPAVQATVKIVAGPKWSKPAITSGYIASGGTCTKAKSIALTNTTAAAQALKFNGTAAGSIPAHKTLQGCITAAKPGTAIFTLTKSGAKLKVTFK